MASEEAGERRTTTYLVLRQMENIAGEGWTPVGEFPAFNADDANKDAAGREPETATPGHYWAVPLRSVAKNRLAVRARSAVVIEYGEDDGQGMLLELAPDDGASFVASDVSITEAEAG